MKTEAHKFITIWYFKRGDGNTTAVVKHDGDWDYCEVKMGRNIQRKFERAQEIAMEEYTRHLQRAFDLGYDICQSDIRQALGFA